MSAQSPEISVVVPALNEAEKFAAVAYATGGGLESAGRAWEVLFVDDGSTDGTAEVLRGLCRDRTGVRALICRRNFGKSSAMQAGFAHVRGEVVVTIDADPQDDPAEIPNLLKALDGGADLVVGWKQSRHDPGHKVALSRVFNWFVRRMSGLPLRDMDCGLKAMRRLAADCVPLYGEMHRFFPVLAHRQGFRVAEVPVRHHARRFGRSKYGARRLVRGAFDFLTVLFLTGYATRPLHFFGKPGLLLIAAGLLINLHPIVQKLMGHYIGHRPLLSLGVLLLILGALFLSNGLLGEMMLYASQGRRARLAPHVVRETCGFGSGNDGAETEA